MNESSTSKTLSFASTMEVDRTMSTNSRDTIVLRAAKSTIAVEFFNPRGNLFDMGGQVICSLKIWKQVALLVGLCSEQLVKLLQRVDSVTREYRPKFSIERVQLILKEGLQASFDKLALGKEKPRRDLFEKSSCHKFILLFSLIHG